MGNVILIGFMGSGKTSVGIKLSYRLRRSMLDTDKMIEKEENRTISKIFAEDGEAYFRDSEARCLQKLITVANNQIISTGGGLPIREENHALLKELGTVIYLRAQAETIYERVKHDTSRPLLQGNDPQEKIRALMEQRAVVYESAADYIIDVDDKGFDQILSEIETLLERSKN